MLDLVKSVSIDNLVNQRAAVAERLVTIVRLLDEARAIARAADLGFPDLRQYTGYRGDYRMLDGDDLQALLRAVDEGGWRHLMNESGLRTFMDAETRNRWDEGLSKGDVPELTAENIAATFRALYDSRGEMFEEGVIKVFKRLSWDYKSHLPQKFGRRIVMRHVCYAYGINHDGANQLDDLVRVFHVVDGKPEPDHREAMYRTLSQAFNASPTWPKGAGTDYLSVRLYKNGNAHVTFLRPDLVDQLNRIIARRFPGALPEPK